MNKSIMIGKEADAKNGFLSAHKSDKSIHRIRDERERQLGSLGGVIGNIGRDGTAFSAESIATELGGRSAAERAPALLALQQTHGNQYVQRVVAGIQAKLTVGQPGDKYEQEADRVADAVMRMPEPGVQRQVEPEEEEEERLQAKPLANQITPLVQVQRQEKTEEEEEMLQAKQLTVEITPLVQSQVEPEEEEEELQAKATSGHISEVTPNLESDIQSLKGGGQPLSENDRAFFEPRFGYDFSQVRVHTDAKAAREVNARAFTVGQDMMFGAGQYAPGTTVGKMLLAHELTHTIQQSNLVSERTGKITIADPMNATEQEAEHVANATLTAQPLRVTHHRTQMLAREEAPVTHGLGHTIEDVIQALSYTDPLQSGGTGDVSKAFRILNGLSMPDLLIVLTQLYRRNYFHGLLGYLAPGTAADDKVIVAIRAVQYRMEGPVLTEDELENARTFLSTFTHEEQNEIKSFLSPLGEHEVDVFLGIPEVLAESTTQPQPSQSRVNRLRTAQQLRQNQAIDVYVDLLKEDLKKIGPYKVHVAKSEKEYRPGVINFDPQPPKPAFVRHDRIPLYPPDRVPEMPQVVIGPKSIVESPIITQATLTHEKTHESHSYLVIKLAKRWKTSSDKHGPFEKWLEKHRKKISDEEYHLIKEFIAREKKQRMTPKKLKHGGVSEIMSNLEAFTSHYHRASEEEVKESLLNHNLNSIAYELDGLRGKAKRYYEEMVCRRLNKYYHSHTLSEGHRHTFDSVLDMLLKKTTNERRKTVYKRWRTQFRRESP